MNEPRFVSLGFNNIVNAARVLCVISPDTLPSKRLIQDARESRRLIDVTCGRKTRCVCILDSGHAVLCGLSAETISARLNLNENAGKEEEELV